MPHILLFSGTITVHRTHQEVSPAFIIFIYMNSSPFLFPLPLRGTKIPEVTATGGDRISCKGCARASNSTAEEQLCRTPYFEGYFLLRLPPSPHPIPERSQTGAALHLGCWNHTAIPEWISAFFHPLPKSHEKFSSFWFSGFFLNVRTKILLEHMST